MSTARVVDRQYRIRAAVLRSPRAPLGIEPLLMDGPRAGEVLVRVIASGICHTDIGMAEAGGNGPVVLGHEGAGVVEELGARVRGVRRGDHVVLSYQSCGHCAPCRHDHPYACDRFDALNFGFAREDGSNALAASGVRGHFFGQSSFATHALVTMRNLVRVPKSLPLEMLAPLGCGFQTGAGTVLNSLRVKRGASIAIFGAGSVGLAAVMAARIAGAKPIIAVDLHPRRLALARRLGATHTIRSRGGNLERKLTAIARAGVDYIVDNTGDAALERIGIDVLKPGGRMALLAGGDGPGDLPDGKRAFAVIQGDAVPQRFIPRLIRLWRRGRFPFDRLVRFYDWRAINRAIADSASGKTVKPILRIGAVR